MSTASLIQTAGAHWRALWPAWVLPVGIYVGALVAEELGHFELFLFAVAMPVIALIYLIALRPWIKGSMSYWHVAVWLILLPGLISLLCLLSGTWIVQLVQGAHHAS